MGCERELQAAHAVIKTLSNGYFIVLVGEFYFHNIIHMNVRHSGNFVVSA